MAVNLINAFPSSPLSAALPYLGVPASTTCIGTGGGCGGGCGCGGDGECGCGGSGSVCGCGGNGNGGRCGCGNGEGNGGPCSGVETSALPIMTDADPGAYPGVPVMGRSKPVLPHF